MTDIAAGKVPVLKCFEQAWRFLFEHWRLLAPAAAVPAIANGVARALSPTPSESVVSPLGDLPGNLIVTIGGLFFTAAVLRKAVRDEFTPPWGLAAGQDEMRLLGVLGCFIAIFLPPIVLLVVLFQVFLFGRIASSPEALEALAADPEAFNEAVGKALGAGGVFMLEAALVTLMVIAVIVLVRLSMANAATFGERRIVFFQTWRWSKGNVLRMLGALVLTSLPAALVDLIVAAAVVGVAGAGPAPVQFLSGGVTGFVQAMLSIPAIALGAILYKGLRPPDFVAK